MRHPHGFASFVIVELGTGRVICETFNHEAVARLNTDRYEAVPIGEYLAGINKAIREGQSR